MSDFEEKVKQDLDGIQCLKENSAWEHVDNNGVEIEVKQIQKLQKNSVEKENNKMRKKTTGRLKKRRKASDPVIKDISELMSTGLRIISPDKPYKGKSSDSVEMKNLLGDESDDYVESNKIHGDKNCEYNTHNEKRCYKINGGDKKIENGEDIHSNQPLIKDDSKTGEGQMNITLSNDYQDISGEQKKQLTFNTDCGDSRDGVEKKQVVRKKKHSRFSLIKRSEDVCSEQEESDGHVTSINDNSEASQELAEKLLDIKSDVEKVEPEKPQKPMIFTDSEDSRGDIKKKKGSKKKKHSRLSLNRSEDLCNEQDDLMISKDDQDITEKQTDANLTLSKGMRRKHKKMKPPIFCTDSEDSQDGFENKESKKKKLSRLSMKSPKGKKFKDCSQQSKLNAFLQIKSPPDPVFENKESKDGCSRLKLSNNLFNSPRSSKKLKEKYEAIETLELTEEILTCEKSNTSTLGEYEKEINVETKAQKPSTPDAAEKNTSSPITQKSQSRKENRIKKASKKVTTNKSQKSRKQSKAESPHPTTPTEAENSPVENVKSGEDPTTPQRNAFQFMMNQRSKVIGSNSPGKELPPEEKGDNKEKKEALVKRRKQLSEWNDSKGGNKRKLEEDEREQYTGKVLISRAKLMKEMLAVTAEEINAKKQISDGVVENIINDEGSQTNISNDHVESINDEGIQKKSSTRKKKTPGIKRKRVLQLESSSDDSNDSSIFKQEDSNQSKRTRIDIPETLDEESSKSNNAGKVQKKLLNFFGVLQKDSSHEDVIQVFEDEPKKPTPLKIKLFNRRGRRKKSSLSLKESSNDAFTDDEILKGTFRSSATDDDASRTSNFSEPEVVKTKRKQKTSVKKNGDLDVSNISFASIKSKLLSKLNAPAREVMNVRSDDEVLVVDDGEGNRRSARKTTVTTYAESDLESSQTKGRSKEEKEKKVAPVFLKSVPKPKEDPAVVQARLDFLRSGVPSELKKIVEKQQSIEDIEFDVFPLISHVQQKDSNPSNLWNLPSVQLHLKETDNIDLKHGLLSLGKVTTVNIKKSSEIKLRPITKDLKYKTILEDLKAKNPDYPVYKTFRLLSEKAGRSFENVKSASPVKTPTPVKRKRGRPRKKPVVEEDVVIVEEVPNKDVNSSDHAMWTEKFRPKSSQDIVGNYKSVTKLRDWLNGWIEFSKVMRMARRKRRRSDSSDFESTDGESKDSIKLPCNTMVLRGPLGSGKSVAVYAVCQELGVNVLEINASSKRTGKKLLQEMQEATQSHQVSKKDSLAMFLQRDKVPKETQESKINAENKMCILLIEDADIVFEQDEGFISALSQLISTSKRPIVLLTSNVDCNYMQKFTSAYPILNFTPLSTQTLAIWLQIVCLLEGLHVDKNAIGELLEWNRGDVRRTLLQLQFLVQSGGSDTSDTSSPYKKYCDVNTFYEHICKDDKSSSLSNYEEPATSVNYDLQKDCIQPFIICSRYKFSVPFPVNLGLIWWNLPDLLKPKSIEDESNGIKKNEELADLQKACDVLDVLSFTDVLYRSEGFDAESEPGDKRWDGGLKEGLNLKENVVEYKTDRSLTHEISHSLIDGYCRLFNPDFGGCMNMAVPVSTEKRRRTKQHECENEYLNVIPGSYSVHRSSFAVDYFPVLRTISRTESERSQNTSKRGNRFYNYLKTLDINPRRSTIKTACDMMNTHV